MKKSLFLIITVLILASAFYIKSETQLIHSTNSIVSEEKISPKDMHHDCDNALENISFVFIVPIVFVLVVGICIIISKLTFRYVHMEENFKYRKQLPRGNPVLI